MSWWVLVHRTIIVAATVLPLAVTSCTGRSAIAPGSEAPAGRSGSTADRRTQERPAVDLWGGFGIAEGHEAGRYASLGAMVRWAPIVVAGTVDAVQGEAAYGEDDPGLENIRVMLRVTEVFKGDALEGQQIPVVVGLTEDGDVEQRFAGLVGDEGIFFIVQSGAPRPEFGISGLPPNERSGNWVPVTSQGIALNDAGAAVFAVNAVKEGFPASLDGIPFSELKDRIRSHAG